MLVGEFGVTVIEHIHNIKNIKSDFHEVPATYKSAHIILETNFYRHLGKRIFDVTFLIVGIVFLVPVLLVIAVFIKLDGGPIFYSQDRLGKYGKVFRFWKFRSMELEADEYLADYLTSNPEAAIEWNTSQKLRNDPRVTPFGRFIRKYSLDELPQLWNVLIGDMSFVGPRPMMPNQRNLYPGKHYETLLPGITGLWQISERNEVSFAARAWYDERYALGLCFWSDIKIMFKTVKVMTNGTGC